MNNIEKIKKIEKTIKYKFKNKDLLIKSFLHSSKHKKLCWILTSMCGALQPQFHPWIKPMKRVPNKSLKQLQQLYPNMKESDLETLDNIISDIRNELGFKGRLLSCITYLPFINKIYDYSVF